MIRQAKDNPELSANSAHSVFLVHGHDEEMMADVAGFLRSNKVEPVILKKTNTKERTLFEKFEAIGGQAKFAIVLMTSDDVAASRREFEHPKGGEKALQYRARQNVILELGFFSGRLGWDSVFILQKPAEAPWPKFDMPSDLGGVMFDAYGEDHEWKGKLLEQLKAKGLA